MQLAHAQAVRGEFVQPWELGPLCASPTRWPTGPARADEGPGVIDPAELTPAATPAGHARLDDLEIVPMRAAPHPQRVGSIEVQSF